MIYIVDLGITKELKMELGVMCECVCGCSAVFITVTGLGPDYIPGSWPEFTLAGTYLVGLAVQAGTLLFPVYIHMYSGAYLS